VLWLGAANQPHLCRAVERLCDQVVDDLVRSEPITINYLHAADRTMDTSALVRR
jgi:hypothetical protein